LITNNLLCLDDASGVDQFPSFADCGVQFCAVLSAVNSSYSVFQTPTIHSAKPIHKNVDSSKGTTGEGSELEFQNEQLPGPEPRFQKYLLPGPESLSQWCRLPTDAPFFQ
jgi:hypothetical protein